MRFLLWHGLARSAQRFPNRPAVREASTFLSYRELDELSDRFAALLASRRIGRGDRVALLMPKSGRAIVSMIGTSKAGAAYVPVDPAAPARRAAFIIGNAGARALVTTRRLFDALIDFLPELDQLEAVVLIDADEAPENPAPTRELLGWEAVAGNRLSRPDAATVEDDPAYLLYTSGSTGTPKGVVISHRNALTFVEWALNTFDVGPEDRLSNHAPLHFDLSVFDIYAALFSGACVFLIPERVAPFPMLLASWIEENEITVWYSVPSALIRLLRQGQLERFRFRALRVVLFAGEVFPVRHLREVMERFESADFYNLYGPTETNVCTYLPVPRPIPETVTELSIGRACANFDTFALTASGTRAAAGEEGELVVRGPGVMLGYWGLPERTTQSLVQNPLHSDFVDPIYRTGDIVRVERGGQFTFLGRRDHMVKTRGYRVELGEIEHALYQHEGVRSAAVIAMADDEIGTRLWAVIVPETPELTAQQLTSFCLTRLPHYAVPEQFLITQDMPRTSTGKVDRQSLAETLHSAHTS